MMTSIRRMKQKHRNDAHLVSFGLQVSKCWSQTAKVGEKCRRGRVLLYSRATSGQPMCLFWSRAWVQGKKIWTFLQVSPVMIDNIAANRKFPLGETFFQAMAAGAPDEGIINSPCAFAYLALPHTLGLSLSIYCFQSPAYHLHLFSLLGSFFSPQKPPILELREIRIHLQFGLRLQLLQHPLRSPSKNIIYINTYFLSNCSSQNTLELGVDRMNFMKGDCLYARRHLKIDHRIYFQLHQHMLSFDF